MGQHLYSKNELRQQLVTEQGALCCYCGSLIENNSHTRMEHVDSKSNNIEKTFDYHNLAAACSGGKYIIHMIVVGDTLQSIADKYVTNVETIKHLNPDIYFKANEELTVRVGTEQAKIKIKVIFDHCDVKKKDKSIAIKPNQPDCQKHFKYAPNGLVYGDSTTSTVVEILGLNDSEFLNEKRRQIREQINQFANIIIQNSPTHFKTIQNQQLQKLYANTGKYVEMAFVHEYFWNTFNKQ